MCVWRGGGGGWGAFKLVTKSTFWVSVLSVSSVRFGESVGLCIDDISTYFVYTQQLLNQIRFLQVSMFA